MSELEIKKKILIMAGGTGGHVFPALSVAEYLIAKGIEVEWLGTRNSLEAKVIGDTSIPIHFISIAGLRGKSLWKKLLSPLFILLAVIQSMLKLFSVKPNCVLGMGGFVTGPGGIAAWLMRKKLLIHEQNAIAGVTNQLLFPFANTVMEAFPGAFDRKKEITRNVFLRSFIKQGKAINVGNPVRQNIVNCAESEIYTSNETDRLRILIIGGSLGAMAINEFIPEVLATISKDQRPEIMHQCGEGNLEETLDFYRRLDIAMDESVRVLPFIDDMAAAYSWAELIVCRAGAITVAEIADVGIASVLIPFPYAVDDHQTENARILEKAGGAFVIQQKDLSVNALMEIVNNFTNNRSLLKKFADAAKKAAMPNATGLAAEKCIEACYA